MSHSPESAEGPQEDYVAGWRATMRLLAQGRSWSGRERNCVFLNCGDGPFADVSVPSGLDFADDGRALAVADWDHDGDLDLWLRNRTGPRLRLMLNRAGAGANAAFVALRLRGTTANRDGVGATVEVEPARPAAGRLVRVVTAGAGFLSQSSPWLHFGLGAEPAIRNVSVRWPGGETESFTGVSAGRHWILEQGRGAAVEWTPPQRSLALAPSPQPAAATDGTARTLLAGRVPLPRLPYRDFDDETERQIAADGPPRLLQLWASWCAPCVAELRDLTARAEALRGAGLELLALSVDGLGEDDATGPQDARRLLDQLGFPFPAGRATDDLLDELDRVQRLLFDLEPGFAVPVSFLLDRQGRLAAIYRGRLDPDVLLRDVALLEAPAGEWRAAALPFPGRFDGPAGPDPLWAPEWTQAYVREHLQAAIAVKSAGEPERALKHYLRALEIDPDHPTANLLVGDTLQSRGAFEQAIEHYRRALRTQPDFVDAHVNLGVALFALDRLEAAVVHYAEALRLEPDLAEAHLNMANALFAGGRLDDAVRHYREALRGSPDDPRAHANLALALSAQRRPDEALVHYRRAVDLRPDHAASLLGLAWILATHPGAETRDPAVALQLAERAATLVGGESPRVLDTLAAALAAAGSFDRAADAARRAADLAAAGGAEALARSIRARLALYLRGEPYREGGPGD